MIDVAAVQNLDVPAAQIPAADSNQNVVRVVLAALPLNRMEFNEYGVLAAHRASVSQMRRFQITA